MRPGGGHSKGAAFERQCAKLIARAFRKQGIKQRECWRSVLSGGHAISFGDLEMSDRLLRMFPFSIECKCWKKIFWQAFIIAPSKRKKSWKEVQWLKQAIDNINKGNTPIRLQPLLVIKENFGPIWAMYQVDIGWQMELFSDFLKRFPRRFPRESK